MKKRNNSLTDKAHYYITGYLRAPVVKGRPAEYIFSGSLIRTSTVRQILEASGELVTFETVNSIYTISYIRIPTENYALCA